MANAPTKVIAVEAASFTIQNVESVKNPILVILKITTKKDSMIILQMFKRKYFIKIMLIIFIKNCNI